MWFSKTEDKVEEKKEEYKCLRIKKESWIGINMLRGFNGCKSFDDVVMFLLKHFEENKEKDGKEDTLSSM